MFGLYRVALSFLLLFSAIAAHAEDPFAAAFGSGYGVGVPSGYQAQGAYGAPPPGYGVNQGGYPGGLEPFCKFDAGSNKSRGEQMALCGCDTKCIEGETAAAVANYQNRNAQTSQSILGSGATASISGQAATATATACDPRYQTMDASTLAALRADPVAGPAVQASLAACASGSGAAAAPVYAGSREQCMQACMAPFQQKYGGDPNNRIDPQMLSYLLQQGQGNDNSNQEPTPPSELGDPSDGSGSPSTSDDDFWARAVAAAKANPLPTPAP